VVARERAGEVERNARHGRQRTYRSGVGGRGSRRSGEHITRPRTLTNANLDS
jgi:hypothetical protein